RSPATAPPDDAARRRRPVSPPGDGGRRRHRGPCGGYPFRVTLRLYDTATRQVREFTPLRPGRVGIYLCGLTVQSGPHLGHLRGLAVACDILHRWLRHSGYQVTLIRNVTDIDDKILAKATEQGRPFWSIAYANERAMAEAFRALNALPPTYEPRATGHMLEMQQLITTLIERGHAYPATVARLTPLRGGRRPVRSAPGGDPAGRGRRPAGPACPARLRVVEGRQAAGAGRRRLAQPLGSGAARMAHRVLRHGPPLPRRRVRHPRRRARPGLPPPRERARPVPRCRARLRPPLGPQRTAQPR